MELRLFLFDSFQHISTHFVAFNAFRLELGGKDVQNMLDAKISESSTQLDDLLRPLGITRASKSSRIVYECIALVLEQEDRLEAVQKEVYMPIAEQRHCKWPAIQSAVRRAAEKAWTTNPHRVQELAGYPLTGCPSAVQFLEMVYNAVVRG
ncbi:MAG TPA: hypothetical protein DGV70_03415 [Faecalibacterium sp.]|nr:hypothetical protein [Faecalibacterium sp.]